MPRGCNGYEIGLGAFITVIARHQNPDARILLHQLLHQTPNLVSVEACDLPESLLLMPGSLQRARSIRTGIRVLPIINDF